MIPGRRLFVVLYAASGAAALVYEVTWTRLLTLQLGHTVAAASTVLAAFMGGLALGAWIAGRTFISRDDRGAARDRPRTGLRTYAVLEIIVAVCALLLPFALAASVSRARVGVRRRQLLRSRSPWSASRSAWRCSASPPPRWARRFRSPRTGRHATVRSRNAAGLLYAANTAGAALGAIAAGFLLVPALGLRGTTWVGVALNVIAAAGAWWLATGSRPEETAENRRARGASSSSTRARKARCGSARLCGLRVSPRFLPVASPGARVRGGGASPASPRWSTRSPGRACSRSSSGRPPTRLRRWRRRSSAGWRSDRRSARGWRARIERPAVWLAGDARRSARSRRRRRLVRRDARCR